MNKEHRALLQRNLILLSQCLNLEAIRPHLLIRRVFTNEMLDDIMAKETELEKKQTFIQELCTRGPNAFDKFVKILQETGHYEALRTLNQGGSLTFSSTLSSSCLDRREGGTVAETEEACQMTVKKAERPMIGKKYYKMTSRPRGFCLIINNIDFQPPYERRKGSDVDAKRLCKVFEELGYIVKLNTNLTSEEMKICLHSFSQENHSHVDSFVVIIMTHGEKGKLLGVDTRTVEVEDIIQLFNNRNCVYLKGKPKVFFLQACRGNKYDEGVPGPEKTDSIPTVAQSGEEIINRIPLVTDILVAYSTIEGYVSIRHEQVGSWFCQKLAKVLMERAWDTHLVDMLSEVCAEVKHMISIDGVKQAPQYDLRGWDKQLFFNPGLYDE